MPFIPRSPEEFATAKAFAEECLVPSAANDESAPSSAVFAAFRNWQARTPGARPLSHVRLPIYLELLGHRRHRTSQATFWTFAVKGAPPEGLPPVPAVPRGPMRALDGSEVKALGKQQTQAAMLAAQSFCERVLILDRARGIRGSDLYRAYVDWVLRNEKLLLSNPKFATVLKYCGWEKVRRDSWSVWNCRVDPVALAK